MICLHSFPVNPILLVQFSPCSFLCHTTNDSVKWMGRMQQCSFFLCTNELQPDEPIMWLRVWRIVNLKWPALGRQPEREPLSKQCNSSERQETLTVRLLLELILVAAGNHPYCELYFVRWKCTPHWGGWSVPLSSWLRRSVEQPGKDKEDRLRTNPSEQLKSWKEHFEERFNRPSPVELHDSSPAETPLQINTDRPSKEEIRETIAKLKSGKAPGPRGILPLSVPGNVFNTILLERMETEIDKQMREETAGFGSEWSCSDQVATVRVIIEQSLEWTAPCRSLLSILNEKKTLTALTETPCGNDYNTTECQIKSPSWFV